MFKQIDNNRLGMVSGAPTEACGVTQETIRGLLGQIEGTLLQTTCHCADIERKLHGVSQGNAKDAPENLRPEESVGVLVSRIGALASALEAQANRISGAL